MADPLEITRLRDYVTVRNLCPVITIGDRIRDLRERAGFKKQADFASALGKPQSQVSDWESGRYRIEIDNLNRIASVVGVSLGDLVDGVAGYETLARLGRSKPVPKGGDDAEELDYDITTGYKRDDIPVIGEGDATPRPELLWDEEGLRPDVEDRISRPFDVRDPRAIAYRVRGDSMVPRYNPGDEVIVSPSSEVEDGNGVFVKLRTGERLLKIARRQPTGWILESENRAYPARFVKKNEIETMQPIVWIRPARRGRGDRK
jgi:transcriptional regulator with XRE-family HTH domain